MASEVLENPITTDEPEKAKPLSQEVTINDAGPCLKHVKVIVAAADVSERVQSKFKEMMHEVQTPGFRPGKAPRKLIEKQADLTCPIHGLQREADLVRLSTGEPLCPHCYREALNGHVD